MTRKLKVGDAVHWETPQGQTSGKITRVITEHTTVAGHTVAGSAADPRYEVESAKSGKHAVHTADALKK